MKFLKVSAAISILLTTFGSQSAVFGEYREGSIKQFPSSPVIFVGEVQKINGIDYARNGNYLNQEIGVCTDKSTKRNAGKLHVDGYCYVESGGKIHAKSSYYYLAPEPFAWKRMYSNFQLDGSEVTSGGIDKGEFVYHCMVTNNSNKVKEIKTLGKYIPANKKCYFGEGVKRKAIHLSDVNYSLFILHDQFYTPNPPTQPNPPTRPPIGYCDDKPKPCYEP